MNYLRVEVALGNDQLKDIPFPLTKSLIAMKANTIPHKTHPYIG